MLPFLTHCATAPRLDDVPSQKALPPGTTTPRKATFVRGTKVKFTIYSAETLSSLTPKPKLRVTLPGLAVKVYATTKQADGGFYVTVNFPTTAQAGTALFRVTGTDANAVAQFTDYSFNLN